MLKAKSQAYSFFYKEQKITYRLLFDKYKTVRLRLIAPYVLEIKMPVRTPLKYAEQSIFKHIDWILAQSGQFKEQAPDTQALPFTKELFIFGKAFSVHSRTRACTQKEKLSFSAQNTYFNQEQIFLHALPILQNSHSAISLTNAEIFVQCGNEGGCADKLTAWRKKTAHVFLTWYYENLWQVFQEKTSSFLVQQTINRHPVKTPWHLACPPLSFRSCRRCFGSCKISQKKQEARIMLSNHLMGLPLEYIEFVILHEFCHLIFPNHSPRFYALFDLVLPRHRILKAAINNWSKTHISF